MTMLDFDHKHILITAMVRKPPCTKEAMIAWLKDTVANVNMKILMGPFAERCETEGNIGITGIAVIETSHISAHCWEEAPVPFINIDLYSCKSFEPEDVIDVIKKHFDPYYIRVMFIDRNDPSPHIISKYTQQIIKIIDMMPDELKPFWNSGNRTKISERTKEQRYALSVYNKLQRKFSASNIDTVIKRKNSKHIDTIRSIKQRARLKNLDFDLTQEWFEMEFKKAKTKWSKIEKHDDGVASFWRATIERKDLTKGYTQDNCQIIPSSLDFVKKTWNQKQLIELKDIL